MARHDKDGPTRGVDGLPDVTGEASEPATPVLAPSRKERRRQRKRRSRKRLLLRITVITLSVLVVLVGSAVGYGYYLIHKIHRIHLHALTAAPVTGLDANTENILMVGSTNRCALTVQYTAYGLCSQGVNGVNSDVVMILHLDPKNHFVSILSIPRDLFVPNARADGANKIDAALYEGPNQLISAIQEDFGIPIQDYVELNFETFANVVNALGGISMYFPEPVYDAYSDLDQTTTGCIHLDGYHALQVVRARHLQYKPPGVSTNDPAYWPQEGQSDLARIRRDHEFLRVMATAVAKNGLSNPITDAEIINGVAPQLQTTLSVSQMIDLVLTYHSVNVSQAPQYTLPVQEGSFGQYYYLGSGYGDIEFPSITQDEQVIDQFLGVGPTTATMTGTPLPNPESVSVSVVDGSGSYDVGSKTVTALQALGFQASSGGESAEVGAEAETVVSFNQLTPAVEAAAESVADSMTGAVVMAYEPGTATGGTDSSTTTTVAGAPEITVRTGSEFAVNPPPAPPQSTTTTSAASGVTTSTVAGGATTTVPAATTTTTYLPGSDEFSAPTPAIEPLEPWDPRACTPSGGEGS